MDEVGAVRTAWVCWCSCLMLLMAPNRSSPEGAGASSERGRGVLGAACNILRLWMYKVGHIKSRRHIHVGNRELKPDDVSTRYVIPCDGTIRAHAQKIFNLAIWQTDKQTYNSKTVSLFYTQDNKLYEYWCASLTRVTSDLLICTFSTPADTTATLLPPTSSLPSSFSAENAINQYPSYKFRCKIVMYN